MDYKTHKISTFFRYGFFSAEKSPARPAKGEAPPKGGPREVAFAAEGHSPAKSYIL
jgi:hypothetical protein